MAQLGESCATTGPSCDPSLAGLQCVKGVCACADNADSWYRQCSASSVCAGPTDDRARLVVGRGGKPEPAGWCQGRDSSGQERLNHSTCSEPLAELHKRGFLCVNVNMGCSLPVDDTRCADVDVQCQLPQ